MWLHPVSVKKNVQTYISPKLCLMPEIKSKYFRTGEFVGIGQTTVPDISLRDIGSELYFALQQVVLKAGSQDQWVVTRCHQDMSPTETLL